MNMLGVFGDSRQAQDSCVEVQRPSRVFDPQHRLLHHVVLQRPESDSSTSHQDGSNTSVTGQLLQQDVNLFSGPVVTAELKINFRCLFCRSVQAEPQQVEHMVGKLSTFH